MTLHRSMIDVKIAIGWGSGLSAIIGANTVMNLANTLVIPKTVDSTTLGNNLWTAT